jgi:hypothetical protein
VRQATPNVGARSLVARRDLSHSSEIFHSNDSNIFAKKFRTCSEKISVHKILHSVHEMLHLLHAMRKILHLKNFQR